MQYEFSPAHRQCYLCLSGNDRATDRFHRHCPAAFSAAAIALIYDGRIVWAVPTEEIEKSGNDILTQFIQGRIEGPFQDTAQL